jgi:SNF2 family DNA or RNA helicase
MKVLNGLFNTIKKERGRVLLFSFSTQTLDRIENFVRTRGISYLRMDGGTPRAARQPMVDQFQKDPDIFVFLLSTKGMYVCLALCSRRADA